MKKIRFYCSFQIKRIIEALICCWSNGVSPVYGWKSKKVNLFVHLLVHHCRRHVHHRIHRHHVRLHGLVRRRHHLLVHHRIRHHVLDRRRRRVLHHLVERCRRCPEWPLGPRPERPQRRRRRSSWFSVSCLDVGRIVCWLFGWMMMNSSSNRRQLIYCQKCQVFPGEGGSEKCETLFKINTETLLIICTLILSILLCFLCYFCLFWLSNFRNFFPLLYTSNLNCSMARENDHSGFKRTINCQ